jgi:hypothetical protein
MTEHCCTMMKTNVEQRCDMHPDPFDCVDHLVYFSEELLEYGLIIHDGTTSYIALAYCPWCGTRLPESRRDELYPDGLYPEVTAMADGQPR